jgi:chemotaxis signal transduction protein
MPTCFVRGILPARQMERMGKLSPAVVRYFGPWTCGFASMRGTEFPVVDLRAKLGLSQGSHGRQACIVVVEIKNDGGPRLVGFVADRVSDVVQVRERDFSHGKVRLAGRQRDLLDPDLILSATPIAEEISAHGTGSIALNGA